MQRRVSGRMSRTWTAARLMGAAALALPAFDSALRIGPAARYLFAGSDLAYIVPRSTHSAS
jgi:hypothetical protein